ncbi:hypothetical protein NG791_23950 [Laspinema sp. D1]|uniref:hypothetical protein n=1 Tax=Laspinema palackyanum TaxID=3231601 RepID=UPI003477F531|nr:hypothetical protein [Laspinema sp. D2b]
MNSRQKWALGTEMMEISLQLAPQNSRAGGPDGWRSPGHPWLTLVASPGLSENGQPPQSVPLWL